MNKYAPYIAAWKQRNREQYIESEKNRHEGQQCAMRLAEILVAKYCVTKVILFGSILVEGKFDERSDIDIAVEGLSGARYFEALAELMDASRWDIDLKPIEDMKGLIRDRIMQGKTIYEKPTNS